MIRVPTRHATDRYIEDMKQREHEEGQELNQETNMEGVSIIVPQNRGLAAATGPNQTRDLARLNVQIDVAQDPVTPADLAAQPLNEDLHSWPVSRGAAGTKRVVVGRHFDLGRCRLWVVLVVEEWFRGRGLLRSHAGLKALLASPAFPRDDASP